MWFYRLPSDWESDNPACLHHKGIVGNRSRKSRWPQFYDLKLHPFFHALPKISVNQLSSKSSKFAACLRSFLWWSGTPSVVLHLFSDASQNNPMDRSGEVDSPSLFRPFLTHARSELCPGLSPRQLVLYQQLIGHELSWLKDSLSLPLRYSYMRSHRLAQAEDVPKEAIIWGWPS